MRIILPAFGRDMTAVTENVLGVRQKITPCFQADSTSTAMSNQRCSTSAVLTYDGNHFTVSETCHELRSRKGVFELCGRGIESQINSCQKMIFVTMEYLFILL